MDVCLADETRIPADKSRTRGSVVAWGTMIQAGRSRARIPLRWTFQLTYNPSSRTMALGSTQPLTEMSLGIFLGGNGQPAHKADNLTTICEPID
jgi:hypothetical protein